MNRILNLCLAGAIAFAASGCVMTRGGDLPDLPTTPAQPAPATQAALSYEFHWQTFGTPNANVGAIMAAVAGPELTQCASFKQVLAGRGSPNQLDITINDSGTRAVGIITGILSGITFTVLPSYARDDYDMTAVLSKNGVEVKRYTYTEHVTQVTELLLVFAMPFVEGHNAPKNAVRDLTQHLIHDIVADGVLNG